MNRLPYLACIIKPFYYENEKIRFCNYRGYHCWISLDCLHWFFNALTMPKAKPIDPRLMAMINMATVRKLVIFQPYQTMWFFPGELETHWKDGRFLFPFESWELKHPQILIYEMNDRKRLLYQQIEAADKRILRAVDFLTK